MSAYPYADASEAVNSLGGSMNKMFLSIAQRRAMEGIQQQRIALARAAQEEKNRQDIVRAQLMQAQIGEATGRGTEATARAGQANQTAALLQARQDAAQSGGDAFADFQQSGLPPLEQGPGYGGEPIAAPEAARRLLQRNMLSQMMRSQMLAAQPKPENVMDAMTKQQALQQMPQFPPALIGAILTGAKSLNSIPHGGSQMDAATGQMVTSPQTLGPGQNLVPGVGGPPLAVGQPKPATAPNISPWAHILELTKPSGGGINYDDPMAQMATNAIARSYQGQAQPVGTTSQAKPVTATNPKTGQKIISYDNGQSWQPMQ